MSASSWSEAVPVVAAVEEQRVGGWSFATRVAFRFAFVYLVLYNIAFVLELFPQDFAMTLWTKYNELWSAIVKPIGLAVFDVQIDVMPNGSGDTTFNYVQVFITVCIAAVATLIWSILDRKRTEYVTLHAWLRVYVRFALALSMIGYGVVKVIPTQFTPPTLDRLLQPIGNASPMGLLWTFMGASPAYTIFSGAGELLAGILLTMRRTTLLGALIAAGIMANVAALNFSYDVPVKLYSTHLLAMAVFLMIPDLRRLANVFVFNRPAEPAVLRPQFRRRWLDLGLRTLRTVGVLVFVAISLQRIYDVRAGWQPLESAPLYGIWDVDALKIDGVERAPLVTDTTRWRKVVFSSYRLMTIYNMDDSRTRFLMSNDQQKRTLSLKSNNPTRTALLNYKRPNSGTLVVNGTLDGKPVEATLRKTPTPEFLLTNRGFHWINEYPFNR